MNIKKFSDAMSQIDNKYIDEALNYKKKSKITWIKFGTVAACFVVLIFVISKTNLPDKQFILSDNSYNVTIKYTDKAFPQSMSSTSLEYFYSEEELFTVFNTDILKGKILSVNNIEINLNGYKVYYAIAQIKVEKVYRGSCDKGNIVSIMLPCPINKNIWLEDTDTVCAMKDGMNGIFMLMPYDENSVLEYNDARLVKKDIADYYFPDGIRFAFLETEDGLIFDRYSYKTISNAKTLDEVEKYIEDMILKVSSINYTKEK